MLADSLYPSGQKKLQKLHADIDAGNTFAAVADEWRAMHLVEKSDSYLLFANACGVGAGDGA
jgi:hypothetical protein|tara:strand:- start:15 stop:200 length:186 start_codon:yes stop_codon:yes gene_type:complete